MKDQYQTWIIVPCFDEECRLNTNAFQEYMISHRDVGFCFVDDGSCDGTFGKLQEIVSSFLDQAQIVRLEKNSGKGEAVRFGINFILHRNEAVRYIGFWDADLATPLEEIDILNDTLKKSKIYLVASGSRIKRMGAFIQRTFCRNVEGKIFALLTSQVLGLEFHETQCGAKLFKKNIAKKVFHDPFISPWVFDVEIFARVRNFYGKAKTRKIVCEVPLQSWKEISGSKINLTSQFKMFFDLLRIFWYYRLFPLKIPNTEVSRVRF